MKSELNVVVQKLFIRITDKLKAEIAKALPAVSEPKKAAFMKACAAEVAGKAQKAASSKKAANKDELATTLKSAQDALTAAQAEAQTAAKALLAELESFLTSDKLDARLIKCAVLVEQLLGDAALMKEMLVAGGAREGRYAQAMRIYSDIR